MVYFCCATMSKSLRLPPYHVNDQWHFTLLVVTVNPILLNYCWPSDECRLLLLLLLVMSQHKHWYSAITIVGNIYNFISCVKISSKP